MKQRKIIIGNNIPSFHLITSEGKYYKEFLMVIFLVPEIYLGYTYYINGETYRTIVELPEHFIEMEMLRRV